MSGEWGDYAAIVIQAEIDRARDEGLADTAAILKRIDAAYPFGERAYWPYKQWLKVRKAAIAYLNGETAGSFITVIPTAPGLKAPPDELAAWIARQDARLVARVSPRGRGE